MSVGTNKEREAQIALAIKLLLLQQAAENILAQLTWRPSDIEIVREQNAAFRRDLGHLNELDIGTVYELVEDVFSRVDSTAVPAEQLVLAKDCLVTVIVLAEAEHEVTAKRWKSFVDSINRPRIDTEETAVAAPSVVLAEYTAKLDSVNQEMFDRLGQHAQKAVDEYCAILLNANFERLMLAFKSCLVASDTAQHLAIEYRYAGYVLDD